MRKLWLFVSLTLIVLMFLATVALAVTCPEATGFTVVAYAGLITGHWMLN